MNNQEKFAILSGLKERIEQLKVLKLVLTSLFEQEPLHAKMEFSFFNESMSLPLYPKVAQDIVGLSRPSRKLEKEDSEYILRAIDIRIDKAQKEFDEVFDSKK